MQSGDKRKHPLPRPSACAFDEGKLRRELLSVISLAVDDRQFLGHDGRQYRIAKLDVEDAQSEIFVSVFAKRDEGDVLVGKYAVMLQEISR